jgi:hypothetical protein
VADQTNRRCLWTFLPTSKRAAMAVIMQTHFRSVISILLLGRRGRQEIAVRRGDYNRLGYAIQLCTVRFLGTFVPEPTAAPRVMVAHLAAPGRDQPQPRERFRLEAKSLKWKWQRNENNKLLPVPFEAGLEALIPLGFLRVARARIERLRRFTRSLDRS